MSPAFAAPPQPSRRRAWHSCTSRTAYREWILEAEGGRSGVRRCPRSCRGSLQPLAPYRNDIIVLGGLTNRTAAAHTATVRAITAARAPLISRARTRRRRSARTSRPASRWTRSRRRRSGRQPASRRSSWAARRASRAAIATTVTAARTATASRGARRRTPNPPEIRPRAVFERLFGAARSERDPANAARAQSATRRACSTRCSRMRKRLQGTLGGADRRKLDEYLYAHPRHRDADPEDREADSRA